MWFVERQVNGIWGTVEACESEAEAHQRARGRAVDYRQIVRVRRAGTVAP